MDEELYRQVLEEHRRPGRRTVLAAIALLLLVIVLGLIYGSTIPQGLRPWMIELLYPPLRDALRSDFVAGFCPDAGPQLIGVCDRARI